MMEAKDNEIRRLSATVEELRQRHEGEGNYNNINGASHMAIERVRREIDNVRRERDRVINEARTVEDGLRDEIARLKDQVMSTRW